MTTDANKDRIHTVLLAWRETLNRYHPPAGALLTSGAANGVAEMLAALTADDGIDRKIRKCHLLCKSSWKSHARSCRRNAFSDDPLYQIDTVKRLHRSMEVLWDAMGFHRPFGDPIFRLAKKEEAMTDYDYDDPLSYARLEYDGYKDRETQLRMAGRKQQ